jgi:hypothetical protein
MVGLDPHNIASLYSAAESSADTPQKPRKVGSLHPIARHQPLDERITEKLAHCWLGKGRRIEPATLRELQLR